MIFETVVAFAVPDASRAFRQRGDQQRERGVVAVYSRLGRPTRGSQIFLAVISVQGVRLRGVRARIDGLGYCCTSSFGSFLSGIFIFAACATRVMTSFWSCREAGTRETKWSAG